MRKGWRLDPVLVAQRAQRLGELRENVRMRRRAEAELEWLRRQSALLDAFALAETRRANRVEQHIMPRKPSWLRLLVARHLW